jgi:hypothetical protein
MQITFITEAGDLFPMEIDTGTDCEGVKALIEVQVPPPPYYHSL